MDKSRLKKATKFFVKFLEYVAACVIIGLTLGWLLFAYTIIGIAAILILFFGFVFYLCYSIAG